MKLPDMDEGSLTNPTAGRMSEDQRLSTIRRMYDDFECRFGGTVEYLERMRHPLAPKIRGMRYWVFDTDPLRTLVPGDVYYLGMNPRGHESQDYTQEGQGYDSYDCWASFPYDERHPCPHCTCLDDKWAAGGQRRHVLQNRIIAVLEAVLRGLRLDCRDRGRSIPKSNLFFFRTESQNQLEELQLATREAPDAVRPSCIGYHLEALKLVRPKVIVCNGNTSALAPFTLLPQVLMGGVSKPSGAKWADGSFTKYCVLNGAPWLGMGSRAVLVGLPHMSWRNPCDRRVMRGGSSPVLDDIEVTLKDVFR